MLLKPSISIFVAIQILIWQHFAQGQPNQQGKRSDQESVNPQDNPADCEEECQCEPEDDKCQCEAEHIRPRCVREKKYCPMLQIPINVLSEGSCRKANPGDNCRFKCKENVTLEGGNKIFCGSTLEWSDLVPQCKEYCPELNIPANVISEGSCRKAILGDVCRFKCKENFPLEGVDKIFCISGLEWNAAVPQCRETCPNLEKTENAVLKGNCKNARQGDTCTVTCSHGYKLDGNGRLTCTVNLTWYTRQPRCFSKEYCPEIEKPENGILSGSCTKATAGEFCEIICEPDYMLKGDGRLFCEEKLEWEKATYSCVKKG